MTGHLTADRRRADRRSGIAPTATEQALALFDAALHQPDRASCCVPLDHTALRAQRDAGCPPSCAASSATHAGVRPPARPPPCRSSAWPTSSPRCPTAEQRRGCCCDLVRTQVAAVLGHAAPDAVDPHAAVQGARLRLAHRRRAAQPRSPPPPGCACPPRSIFDHPTPHALAAYLARRTARHAARADRRSRPAATATTD